MPDVPVDVPVPLLAVPVSPVLLCVPYDVPPALPLPLAPLPVVLPVPPVPLMPDELPDVPPVPPVPDALLVVVSLVVAPDVVPLAELVFVPALSWRPHAETDNASATPAAIQSCFMRRCSLQC